MAIKIKVITNKTMYILGSKTKNDQRHFFMNRSGKAISQERKS